MQQVADKPIYWWLPTHQRPPLIDPISTDKQTHRPATCSNLVQPPIAFKTIYTRHLTHRCPKPDGYITSDYEHFRTKDRSSKHSWQSVILHENRICAFLTATKHVTRPAHLLSHNNKTGE